MSHEDSVIVAFTCENGERRYLAKERNGALYQTTDMRNAAMFDKGYNRDLWANPKQYAAAEVDRAYEYWPNSMPANPLVHFMTIELHETDA